MQRIRARLGRSRIVARGGRTLNVEIVLSDGRYTGKLSLVETDGRVTSKTLEGHDCEDLVDALSLVAALAVEDAEDDEARIVPSATPPASATAAPVAPPGPVISHPFVERASAAVPVARTGLDLGALVAVGPAPTPVYGGVLSFDWVSLGDGWLRPAFQLGAAAGFAPDLAETSGTARFAWISARAAAYLLRWALGPGGAMLRCGVVGDVGALFARGLETTSPASTSRMWLSLGVGTSLEVPLGSSFAVRPVVGVEAPLRRDRYGFGSTDFFEVPFVIATGSVSVVAYF